LPPTESASPSQADPTRIEDQKRLGGYGRSSRESKSRNLAGYFGTLLESGVTPEPAWPAAPHRQEREGGIYVREPHILTTQNRWD
jgi:hypothetical protein